MKLPANSVCLNCVNCPTCTFLKDSAIFECEEHSVRGVRKGAAAKTKKRKKGKKQ